MATTDGATTAATISAARGTAEEPGTKPGRGKSKGKGKAGQEPLNPRAARVATLRRAQQRRERRTAALQWGIGGLVLLVIAGSLAAIVIVDSKQQDLGAVQSFEQSQGHVTDPVTYNVTPPAGGQHDPVWLNCGIYDQPVRNENAVHSQEHGAVWVTYRPDLPADQVATLRDELTQTYEILSPFPNLPAPVVASAWGKQLTLDRADDPRLAAFIREYRQAASAPEAGAACTEGTGTPTGGGI